MQQVLTAALLLGGATAHPADADDPHAWLEDVDAPRSLAWVREHNAVSTARITQDPAFGPLRDDIRAILDSKDRIPYVHRMGARYYNFWRDAEHPRGLWRRTTLDEYRKPQPTWETVLDLDRLASEERENWVWQGAVCREDHWDRCLLHLSRGGADAAVVREFDLATRSFVAGGFELPEAKSRVYWIDRDSLFVGTDFGPGSLTDSGYPRIVKLWRRGTPLSAAAKVYEGQATDVSVTAAVEGQRGARHQLITRATSFYTAEYWLRENGHLQRLDVPEHAIVGFFGPQLLVQLRKDWEVAGQRHAAGSLLAADFSAFRQGERRFQVLFEPGATTALEAFTVTRSFVLLSILDKVKGRLARWRFEHGHWSRGDIDAPAFGSLGVAAVDADDSDDYFLTHVDFLTPDTLYLAHAGREGRELLKQRPAFFDASGLQIEQYEASSRDGTRVPYFVVHRKAMPLDGNQPTLLYGYGGFEISLTPSYSASIGKGWLEKGGVYVLANIRGGGEFGPRWHEAALKEKRQNAYDDFVAVAQDLVARGITKPARLGIMGGSNGGLLMGVMLTQHPELFGAVVCQVPLLDMRRYSHLLAGASWMAEYGDPDDPQQWEYIRRYSPYQNLRGGQAYPDVLFATSTRDDRVHPGHARKMMARMEELGVKNAWYYENIEGGHAGAADNAQTAYLAALAYTFLWQALVGAQR